MQRAVQVGKRWKYLTNEERHREITLFSLEQRMLWAFLSMCINTRVGDYGGQTQTLVSDTHGKDKSQWAQTEIQEVLSKDKRQKPSLFYCKDSGTREQVVWAGCGVSVSGETQNKSGHALSNLL